MRRFGESTFKTDFEETGSQVLFAADDVYIDYHAMKKGDTLVIETSYPETADEVDPGDSLPPGFEAALGEEGSVVEYLFNKAFPGEVPERFIFRHISVEEGSDFRGRDIRKSNLAVTKTIAIRNNGGVK